MSQEFLISVDDDGKLNFIYADELAFLLELGPSETKRASHVEPAPGGWTADMSPVAPGTVLGPFALRGEALAAEVEFLKEKLF